MYRTKLAAASAGSVLFVALFAVAMTTPAAAQSPEEIEAIRRCSKIEDTGARYRCYDEVMRSQTRNTQRPSLPVPGSAPAPEVQRNRGAAATAPAATPSATNPAGHFGLKTPPPGEPDVIDVRIVEARKSVTGKWMFTTSDGQLWVQNDTKQAIYHHPEFNAKIKKGMIGGFFLNPEGPEKTVRVRRVK